MLEHRSSAAALLVLILVAACAPSPSPSQAGAREPVIGGPCEGCEAVFEGRPSRLTAEARIAPANEPGEALRLEGTVFDRAGKAAPGIIVYAYQTNARGVYPRDDRFRGQAAHRHGKLRAWARSDSGGHYAFDTIRPGSYPDTRIPQHIHLHVIEPGRATYYIDDVHFTDDPFVAGVDPASLGRGRGGRGFATPMKDDAGRWRVRREIHLGEGIADMEVAP